MSPELRLIDAFYTAFAERDGDAMAASYRPDGRFSDPVFPALSGAEAGDMWRMLCERGADLRVEHSDLRAGEAPGEVLVHWEAWYTFSTTGRSVHNLIDARFLVEDGQIVEHADHFDFWLWSRQALGLPGMLLGWTPLLQGKVQKTAGTQLARFRDARG